MKNHPQLVVSRLALVGVGVVGLLVVAGVYYYSAQSSSNSVEVDIMIMGDGIDYYSPANATVHEGQRVTIVVFNSDDNTHGLVLPAFNVDTGVIISHTTARVSFMADRVGTFPFSSPLSYCGGGRGNACNSEQDLNGTLTVKP